MSSESLEKEANVLDLKLQFYPYLMKTSIGDII